MTEIYNYLEHVKEDVKEYYNQFPIWPDDKEELRETLNDECFNEDSITGNGSGSYMFNTMQAEINLLGNWSLLKEAINELDPSFDPLVKGPEACDVLIRCYLVSQAVDDLLPELSSK